jgi:nitrous oxidase accessory protein NosD
MSMAASRRDLVFAVAVGLLGTLALVQERVEPRRPSPSDQAAGAEFVVTSPRDRGPGTLREALFSAASATGRPRIVLRISEIRPETPLPPLVHPEGTVVTAVQGGAVIDASDLVAGEVLDVLSPLSTLRGFTIRNAPAAAIRVRVAGVQLEDLDLESSAIGVEVLGGSRGLVLRDSRFRDNGIGVRLEAGEARTEIFGNRFSGHLRAAVWAVGGERAPDPARTMVLRGNRFENDETSMVLADLGVEVEDNEVVGARNVGIYLSGRGVRVRGNRVRGGEGNGVVVAHAEGALVTANEIDHQAGAGILVTSCRGTTVRDNRIYESGFGLISVFGDAGDPNTYSGNAVLGHRADGFVVVGGSPVLRANRATGNGRAGLRIMDYVDRQGERRPAAPLVQDLRLEGNGDDQPVREDYREPQDQVETP